MSPRGLVPVIVARMMCPTLCDENNSLCRARTKDTPTRPTLALGVRFNHPPVKASGEHSIGMARVTLRQPSRSHVPREARDMDGVERPRRDGRMVRRMSSTLDHLDHGPVPTLAFLVIYTLVSYRPHSSPDRSGRSPSFPPRPTPKLTSCPCARPRKVEHPSQAGCGPDKADALCQLRTARHKYTSHDPCPVLRQLQLARCS